LQISHYVTVNASFQLLTTIEPALESSRILAGAIAQAIPVAIFVLVSGALARAIMQAILVLVLIPSLRRFA